MILGTAVLTTVSTLVFVIKHSITVVPAIFVRTVG